jgi:hypothetical protein
LASLCGRAVCCWPKLPSTASATAARRRQWTWQLLRTGIVRCRGARCLELGCGIGITGAVVLSSMFVHAVASVRIGAIGSGVGGRHRLRARCCAATSLQCRDEYDAHCFLPPATYIYQIVSASATLSSVSLSVALYGVSFHSTPGLAGTIAVEVLDWTSVTHDQLDRLSPDAIFAADVVSCSICDTQLSINLITRFMTHLCCRHLFRFAMTACCCV